MKGFIWNSAVAWVHRGKGSTWEIPSTICGEVMFFFLFKWIFVWRESKILEIPVSRCLESFASSWLLFYTNRFAWPTYGCSAAPPAIYLIFCRAGSRPSDVPLFLIMISHSKVSSPCQSNVTLEDVLLCRLSPETLTNNNAGAASRQLGTTVGLLMW